VRLCVNDARGGDEEGGEEMGSRIGRMYGRVVPRCGGVRVCERPVEGGMCWEVIKGGDRFGMEEWFARLVVVVVVVYSIAEGLVGKGRREGGKKNKGSWRRAREGEGGVFFLVAGGGSGMILAGHGDGGGR
jgi:hypothetical protein